MLKFLTLFLVGGQLGLVLLMLLGQSRVAFGDFLAAAAQLFLQGFAGLFALQKIDAPFTQGVPLQVHAFLRLGELREPAAQDPFGLLQLLFTPLHVLGRQTNAGVLKGKVVLRLLQLPDRRVHDRAALQPLLAILLVLALLALQIELQRLQLLRLPRQVRLRGCPDPVRCSSSCCCPPRISSRIRSMRLRSTASKVACWPSSEARQRSGQTRGRALPVPCFCGKGEPIRFVGQLHAPLVHLQHLRFQIGAGDAQLIALPAQLVTVLLELAFTLCSSRCPASDRAGAHRRSYCLRLASRSRWASPMSRLRTLLQLRLPSSWISCRCFSMS